MCVSVYLCVRVCMCPWGHGGVQVGSSRVGRWMTQGWEVERVRSRVVAERL